MTLLKFQVRSTADPFKHLKELTNDSLDFGMESATGAVFGLLLLLVGICLKHLILALFAFLLDMEIR